MDHVPRTEWRPIEPHIHPFRANHGPARRGDGMPDVDHLRHLRLGDRLTAEGGSPFPHLHRSSGIGPHGERAFWTAPGAPFLCPPA